MRLVPVLDALSSLKTGDLLFTRSQNWSSKLQMWFCQTYINHVAMAYRAHTGDLWIFDVSPQGAYMAPLMDFVRYNWKGLPPRPSEMPPIGLQIPYVTPRKTEFLLNKSAVYVRRLAKPLDDRACLRFLQRNIGRPYSYRWWMSAFFASPFALHLPISWHMAKDNPGMFCTELLAHLFAEQGFLNTQGTPPSSIMPSAFWENTIQWTNGQGLQDAEQLIGDESMLQKVDSIQLQEQDRRVWLEGARSDTLELQARSLVDLLHIA